MKKLLQNYFRNFLLILIPMAFSNNSWSQVVNTQSFDVNPFPPTGWTLVGPGTLWFRVTSGNNPNATPHTGAGFARYNSRTSAAGTTQSLVTPVIDLSGIGANTSTFSFWMFRDAGIPASSDSIVIYVNTAQNLTGATLLGSVARLRTYALPDTQATNGWYQYSYNIPAGFNTATNYILISAVTDLGVNGNNMYIDDVQWTSYPTQCAGTPSPGTLTATDTVLCGGTGSTTLTLSGVSAGTGISYQWKSGPSATGPWTNFGTSVPSISTGTITTTTYYYAVVTCSNSASSDSSAIKHVTVSGLPNPSVNVTSANNGNYCPGTPVRLIATGATTYSWSPATNLNVTNNDTVFSSLAGIAGTSIVYTATGFNAAGCVSTDTIHVTVRAATPVTIQALNNDTICIGQLLILNALSGGGPAFSSFAWSPGGSAAQAITISPSSDITYNVQVTNIYGCHSADTIDITVIASTVPIINSVTANNHASYCAGLTPVMLHVSGSNYVSAHWAPSTGLSATTGDTVYASPIGVGSSILYAVTLTNVGGCSISDTVRVYSHDLPTVNVTMTPDDDSLCIGQSVTLFAQGTSATDTFLWSPAGGTTQSITVSPSTPTVYSVHVISSVSGCPNSDTVSIAVAAPPVAAFSFVKSAFIATFTNLSNNATTYIWDFGDATGSTLQSPPPHTYATNGTYPVTLMVNNGYCTDTIAHLVDINVGLNELDAEGGILVYLNPSTDMAYVQFNFNQAKATLNVINTLGQVVLSRVVSATGNNLYKEEIDMSGLPSGVYSIQVSSASKYFSKKLIKM